MSSFLLCTTPVRGHVTPVLAVAGHLVDAGHDVRVLTGARYRAAVESVGGTWLPLPDAADFDDRDVDAAFPGRVGLRGPAAIRWDLTEIFLRPAPAQLAAVDEALAEQPADAVLAESMFVGAMLLLARDRPRPPVVNLGIVPLGVDSVDTAPFGLGVPPRPGALGRLRNAALRTVAQRAVFAPVQRLARTLARDAGGELTGSFMQWPVLADALVQFTVPSFEYPRSDLPPHVHLVGPLTRTRPSSTPAPPWWPDLDGERPVVHVTQGTVANADLGALVQPTLDALADDDVLVVVSTGGREAPELRVPPNARVATDLPYDLLLPRTDVMVTNGGYGGVHAALEHGVPLVVAGRTEEKVEVSARVSWSGVGIDLRTDRPTADQLGAAVRSALSEPSYRLRAVSIGQEIRDAPGLAGLDDVLATLLQRPVGAPRPIRSARPTPPQEIPMTPTTGTPSPNAGSALPDPQTLRARLAGTLRLPTDPDWATAGAPWNLAVTARPLAIVEAADAADVQAAVQHAARHGVRLAMLGAGHGASERLDGILAVRSAGLNRLEVDTQGRTAVVGAGITWGELQAALDPTGLTGLVGSSPSVSVVGLLVQGGYSWLSREHGAAAGSLRAAEVITADGERRWLTEADDGELLWGLRGGGGGLAAVTAVEIDLVPAVGLAGGRLMFPAQVADRVLAAWQTAAQGADRRTSLWASLITFPPLPELPEQLRGQSFAAVDAVSTAGLDELAAILAPIRAAGPVVHDTIGPRLPSELAAICEEPTAATPAVQGGLSLAEVTAATLDELLAATSGPSPFLQVQLRHVAGSPQRRDGFATSIDAVAVVNALAIAPTPAAVDAAQRALAVLGQRLAPWVGGAVLPSFVPIHRSLAQTQPPERVERLRALAGDVDPAGLFTGSLALGSPSPQTHAAALAQA